MSTRANVLRWRDMVTREVDAQGSVLPVGFVLAIMDKESQGVPTAYRAEPAINDGSIGLMQMLLQTAKGVGYTGPRGEAAIHSGLFDPATNIHYGVKHLTSLWRSLGNAADVASAYNGGTRFKLGYGRKYQGEPYDTVLARDQVTGKPITTRTVHPGEYANQPYVDTVLAKTFDYSNAQALPGVQIDGEPSGSAPVGILLGVAALGIGAALWLRGR